MLTLFRNYTPQKTHILVLGNPVQDAYLDVDEISFPDQRVVFRVGQSQFAIDYRGEPIRFGEKRFAQSSLASVKVAGLRIQNGGGVYHTTTQLARLCAERQLPVALHAIDLAVTWPELVAAYKQFGVNHLSLASEHSATNLVLTNGKPDRLILRSPYTPTQLTDLQLNELRQMLPAHPDILAVNSPISADLARAVIQTAQKANAAQYSVLTPSLSITDRIELLLKRDRASVCNLSELALIAGALGIDCPAEEETASIVEVAQVMAELAGRCKTGDLVVTLGARGCVAGDRARGTLAHVGLDAHVWPRVQEQVLASPDRKNGVGDRFFGSFVLAHALSAGCRSNRTAQAARSAAVEMVRQLAPELAPTLNWCAVRQLPHHFGARTSFSGRKTGCGHRGLRVNWRSLVQPGGVFAY